MPWYGEQDFGSWILKGLDDDQPKTDEKIQRENFGTTKSPHVRDMNEGECASTKLVFRRDIL